MGYSSVDESKALEAQRSGWLQSGGGGAGGVGGVSGWRGSSGGLIPSLVMVPAPHGRRGCARRARLRGRFSLPPGSRALVTPSQAQAAQERATMKFEWVQGHIVVMPTPPPRAVSSQPAYHVTGLVTRLPAPPFLPVPHF